nr:glutamic acid-rich protein-like [Tanacetum cinerariifolium]
MGYEKPSTKLTFYKAFFSTQWKFFIHTILHSLSDKRTSWNEFSSAMASALICLSSGQRFNFSKYIFESLVCNVDSSSKFYMYPRVGKGFSGVETPLFENMLVVRAVDTEEEVQVPAQDDVVQEHVIEEIAIEVVPPTPTSPLPSSPVLDKCSALVLRVEGLENANAAQQLEIIKLKARVKKLERLNKVKSSKLRRLRKVGTSQRVESSATDENVFNQGRISVDMDQDEGIELVVDQEKDAEIEGRQADKQLEIYNIDLDHSSKVLSMQEDDTEVQKAVEVVTTAKLITKVVTTAATQVVAASTPISAAKLKTLKIADAAPAVSTRRRKGVVIRDPKEELHTDTPAETPTVKYKGKGILIKDPKPMKKKDRVEMDTEYAKKLQEELNKEHEEAYKNIDWNAAFDHVQAKKTQYIKRYHGFKKKPQSKSEARKNMISYLKNTEGYKMEFFKGKTYDQILPIFQARFDANLKFLFKTREEMEKQDEEIIKSINETPAQKAAKRRKLSEEAQKADDLKKRLEIVQDEDDDVFVEAIPLAQKVPVVGYQVVVIDNKPRYKIIRADDTRQFYISFITLLKNFDREDLETLWKIVKDRFSTKKPTNFSDVYLLLTLKTMFGELDEQDAIWRNQKSVHGLALVKR